MASTACRAFVFVTVVASIGFHPAVSAQQAAGQQPPSGQQPAGQPPAGQSPAGQPAAGQPPPAGRGGQPPAPGGAFGRRATPPQPQQKQSADYFVGSWEFTWTGRESPITPGPRSGMLTVTKSSGAANRVDLRTTGKIEDGPAFTETATLEYDEVKKAVTVKEKLWNGTELQGAGDWASPLSIKYESQPTKAGTQTVRLRRTYAILSATSFTVAEEISIDNGPFQRLGNGSFSKR